MTDPKITLWHGDCLTVMAGMPDASVDAIVTDPPYGLGFMGKAWDDLPPGLPWARECLRVLKPGGHLLAFGGTRTWHRLAVAIEDAGLEMRDSIAWLYGSGFPKSLDVSKAIDAKERFGGSGSRQLRARDGRQVGAVGTNMTTHRSGSNDVDGDEPIASIESPAAQQWAGWGTALKPAFEPIIVARKPLAGTVAGNVQAWGTGALNIDGTRVGNGGTDSGPVAATGNTQGRWPTNVILDDTAADELDTQTGTLTSGKAATGGHRRKDSKGAAGGAALEGSADGSLRNQDDAGSLYGDSGGASRFFPTFRYQAKAPARERPTYVDANGVKQAHSTVKPLELMRWLVRLVTPPGGTVLDPFAGTGTTGEACILEGFGCVLIEREADHLPFIEARLARQDYVDPAVDEADDDDVA